MNRAASLIFAIAVLASSQALAETSYMSCFGGGRQALYWSAVFAVPHGTSTVDKAKAFIAFVQGKYGAGISAECHSSGTQTSADSDKKIREDVDQTSKFPSKIIETGWMGS